MASQLQIYNLAFAHLGEALVDNITDDPPQPNVRKANAQWPQALDVALSRAPWLCALERRTITRSPTDEENAVTGVAGDFAYPYVFMLPVETMRVFYVDDCGAAFRWERSRVVQGPFVGRPVIRADTAGPLKVALTRRTIPELLTPLLCDALGYELAARLAVPIQADAGKAKMLRGEADRAYGLAMGAECGEQGGEDPILRSPLTEARARAY